MINVRTGIRPEEIRFQGQRVLFVEGKDDDALDPQILVSLFSSGPNIVPVPVIRALGSSFSVRSVAEALFKFHPTY